MLVDAQEKGTVGKPCLEGCRVALSYFDKAGMSAKYKMSAPQGITLLHLSLAQDVSSGPVMVTFSHHQQPLSH